MASSPPPRPPRADPSCPGPDADPSPGADARDESPASREGDSGPVLLRSPAGLLYDLRRLPESKRAAVADAFREPPDMALQHCRRIDDTYTFQMSEVVPTAVRVRSPAGASPRLSCSCGGHDAPCRHLVWLMDQVASQTLYGPGRAGPLTMAPDGHAAEMGDPFQSMACHRLSVLAEGLHCRAMRPTAYGDDEHLDPHRIVEARELLSSVYGLDPDDFRPDLFAHVAAGQDVLGRHDLDHAVLRMLLDNAVFFRYFLSLSRATDAIRDPFRKLSQRADGVLRDLNAYSQSPGAELSPEPPADVSWAAGHLVGIVGLVRALIRARDTPPQPRRALSAARTLVHILEAVVARNHDAHAGPSRDSCNLYLRLVGDHDRGFAVAELHLIPDAASHFLHRLEAIHDEIGVHGAPASYVDSYRSLLSRLRTCSTGGPGRFRADR